MTLAIVMILLMIVLAFFMGKSHPSQDAIYTIQQELSKQYDKKIIDLDRQLKEKNEALKLSNTKYLTLINKLEEVKNAKNKIKIPETDTDIVHRLDALGYKSVRK